MIEFDAQFEHDCAVYLDYLYQTATHKYRDCTEIDSLVQETMLAYLVKLQNGDRIEHPKAFLAKVLQNKYNTMLREKYRDRVVVYELPEMLCDDENSDGNDLAEEYAAVRRELGRLIKIYREVTVRYYVHGQRVEQIAAELGIPKGTVTFRLARAREQIKEGISKMEKYAQISYEPKKVTMSIWGSEGMCGEPFSLVRTPIESSALILAYEKPISLRTLAGAMGMPSAYLEPMIEKLVEGELMGRTDGGLLYTRCFLQKCEDKFGDIPAQEALAKKHAKDVWKITWKHLEPLTERELFKEMTEKQKATMILHTLKYGLNHCAVKSMPELNVKAYPERPNGGRWLATGSIHEGIERKAHKYDCSGPVIVGYRPDGDGKNICQLFDCQSLFGDAHWAYAGFRYQLPLQTIMRFYASLLPCDVKPENDLVYELIPEFEKLHILRRDKKGEIALDIPALPYDEVEIWNSASVAMNRELYALLSVELAKLSQAWENKVPKYVDGAEYYHHVGGLGVYSIAQLVEIVEQGLMPYAVEIGKTPLIYLAYRRKE